MESKRQKQGFTLVEVMIAMVLTFLIATAVFSIYYWSTELGTLCGKKNRSQVAAMTSSVRIMDCIRNASAISVDMNGGRWAVLTYPDGTTATLAYTNSPETASGGALGLFRNNRPPIWFVRNGITQIMGDQGFDSVVFSVKTNTPNPKILYVKYRVSQPSANGGRDTNDGKYAMHVRFATCLRNAPID